MSRKKKIIGEPAPIPAAMVPKAEYHHGHTSELQNQIIDMYVSGDSLHAIAKKDGMPSYATLLRWVHDLDTFREEFERARKLRALHFEERALELIEHIEDTGDKDRAAVARLKYDILAWGTSVNDSSRYGKKTTIEGNADKPVVFQIVSHIPDASQSVQDARSKARELVVESEVVE